MTRDPRLAECYRDLLVLAGRVGRRRLLLPPAAALRVALMESLDRAEEAARRAGFGRSEIDDATFAVVALLDEVIRFSEWEDGMAWSARPLQAVRLGEASAGVRFFERLARVRGESPAALEVFHHCLVLGLRGVHRERGGQEPERLLAEIRVQLGLAGAVSLPTPPPPPAARGRRVPPRWPIIALLVAALAVAWLLRATLASRRARAVARIEALASQGGWAP